MNGPSRCAPSTFGPIPSRGIACSAAVTAASGAVTNVGANAVTPVRSSASPARA